MATARTKRFDTGVPDGRYFVVVQYCWMMKVTGPSLAAPHPDL